MTVGEEQCGWKEGQLNFFLWDEVWVVDTEGRRALTIYRLLDQTGRSPGTSAVFADRIMDPYQTHIGHWHQSPTSRAGSARSGVIDLILIRVS